MKLFPKVKGCALGVSFMALHAASAQPLQPLALPDAVTVALKIANVPASAVGIVVAPLSGTGLTLTANENVPMHPASTM
jgi:D-alanyl-D-alanine carboxypeptidase